MGTVNAGYVVIIVGVNGQLGSVRFSDHDKVDAFIRDIRAGLYVTKASDGNELAIGARGCAVVSVVDGIMKVEDYAWEL